MRVNARLDEGRTAKLCQLQSSVRVSASETVKRTLDLLHKRGHGSGNESAPVQRLRGAVLTARRTCRAATSSIWRTRLKTSMVPVETLQVVSKGPSSSGGSSYSSVSRFHQP